MDEPQRGPAVLFQYRFAVEADVAAIARLINSAYRVEDFFIDGDRTDAADVRDHMARGSFLVAESAPASIAGSVFVSLDGEEGYFGLLSVDPGAQGAGLGRQLVEAAEAHCRERGATSMGLKVVNLRSELPPWYRRLGYAETGTEPFPEVEKLKHPAHFIAMSKPLMELHATHH